MSLVRKEKREMLSFMTLQNENYFNTYKTYSISFHLKDNDKLKLKSDENSKVDNSLMPNTI